MDYIVLMSMLLWNCQNNMSLYVLLTTINADVGYWVINADSYFGARTFKEEM